MLVDGLTMTEGSTFKNLTVAYGTSFPINPDTAELFYRSDLSLLHVFNGTAWGTIAPAALAGTLAGDTLASNVIYSSLTTVGTLTGLQMSGTLILGVTTNGVITTATTANLNANSINLTAGTTTAANGFGGNLNLTAGAGTGAGAGGNVVISGGVGTASGDVIINTAGTERLRILENGAWSVGSDGTSTGAAGYVLTSQGASLPPIWAAQTGFNGGTITNALTIASAVPQLILGTALIGASVVGYRGATAGGIPGFSIQGPVSTTAGNAGGGVLIDGGGGPGAGANTTVQGGSYDVTYSTATFTGGSVIARGGSGGANGLGGNAVLQGGSNGSGSIFSGPYANIQGGSAPNQGGIVYISGGLATNAANPGGAIVMRTAQAGTGTSHTERFRILADGSWSIGSDGTSVGTTGQVLTSAGAGVAPAWQTPTQWNGGTVSNAVSIISATPQLTLGAAGVHAVINAASGALPSNLTLNAGAGTGAAGGTVLVQGGLGATGFAGGATYISGGNTSGAATAGNVYISAGVNTNSGGAGGALVMQTGVLSTLVERFRILHDGSWSIGSAGTNVGSSGQILTSNGPGVPPTWQAPAVQSQSAGTLTGTTLAANVIFSSLTTLGTLSSITTSGNLSFSAAGQRISGNFSDATVANRVLVQTNVANGATYLGLIPNGIGNITAFEAYNSTDTANTSVLRLSISNTDARIIAGTVGAGTALPISFFVNGVERYKFGTAGEFGVAGNYGTAGQILTSTGTGAAPAWSSTFSGNAATATILVTSRNLWGQAFNGSADVTGSLTSVGDITGTAGVTLTATNAALNLSATGANPIVASTGGLEKFRIGGATSEGVGIGTTSTIGRGLVVSRTLSGATSAVSIESTSTVPAGANDAYGIKSALNTQATAFTLPALAQFLAAQGTIGAGSSITAQIGFLVDASLTGGTYNYGFRSQIPAGTGRYNLFMDGTAVNYMAGNLGVGVFPNAVGTIALKATPAGLSALTIESSVGADAIRRLNATGSGANFGFLFSSGAPYLAYQARANGAALGFVASSSAAATAPAAVVADSGYVSLYAGPTQTNSDGAAVNMPERVRVDGTSGGVGIGTTALTARGLVVGNTLTGSTLAVATHVTNTLASDVTAAAHGFRSALSTAAAVFTLADIFHFSAIPGTFGAGSTVTRQTGFYAGTGLTGAATNYGFWGEIPAGAGRYNLYMSGTAQNYLAGWTGFGKTVPDSTLHVYENNANANLGVTIEQAGTGDAVLQFLLTGVRRWMVGIDHSDGDKLKIGTGADLSVSSAIAIDVTNKVGIGTASPATNLEISQALDGVTLRISSLQNDSAHSTSAPYGSFEVYSADVSTPAAGVKGSMKVYPVDATGFGGAALAFGVSTGTSNNVERLRIDGPGGGVGISSLGVASLLARGLVVANTLFGNTTAISVYATNTVMSDVTANAYGMLSSLSTIASAFTLTNLYLFNASQGTFGAGSAVTNQTGFHAGASLVGATNNYGFRGQIPAGANRYNLYMDGTAVNYMEGNLGIGALNPSITLDISQTTAQKNGIDSVLSSPNTYTDIYGCGLSGTWKGAIRFFTSNNGAAVQRMHIDADGGVGIGATSLTARGLVVGNALTGSTVAIASSLTNTINSDVTVEAYGFHSRLNTQAAAFTLGQAYYFAAIQGTIGAGSTVTTQNGFYVDGNFVGATNNYGFRGAITAGTGRYNLYMDGTADNYMAGKLGLGTSTPKTLLDLGVGTTGGISLAWGGGTGLDAQFTTISPLRSSGALMLGFGYDTSSTVVDGFVSSYSTGIARSAIVSGGGYIRMYTDATATVAKGTALTPTLRLNIDSNGQFALGSTGDATYSKGGISDLSVAKSTSWATISARAYAGTAASGGLLVLGKSRSGVIGTLVETQASDTHGYVIAEGVNASSANRWSSAIAFEQDGAAGVTFVPGRIVFRTGSSTADVATRATLNGAGNLGLGATPSVWNADYRVMQIGSHGAAIYGRASTNEFGFVTNNYRDTGGVYRYTTTNFAQRHIADGTSGNWYWDNASSGAAGAAVTFTTSMMLDNSGRLGIGTTSNASFTLGVATTAKIAGTNPYLAFGPDFTASTPGFIQYNTATDDLDVYGLYGVSIKTAAGLSMRFEANGSTYIAPGRNLYWPDAYKFFSPARTGGSVDYYSADLVTTSTGAIAVELPSLTPSESGIRLTLKIFTAVTGESFDLVVGGSISTTGTWTTVFAYTLGNPLSNRMFNVRFGSNTGSPIVYIGELATVWTGLNVYVLDVEYTIGGNAIQLEWPAIRVEPTAFWTLDATITTSQVGLGFKPINSRSAAYTTVMSDALKLILHPSADTTARTFTIDSNANVPYPPGTELNFVNQNGAGVLTIAITTDTMRLAGAGTTGSRTLAANGVATARKLTATEWIISGTGLT